MLKVIYCKFVYNCQGFFSYLPRNPRRKDTYDTYIFKQTTQHINMYVPRGLPKRLKRRLPKALPKILLKKTAKEDY